MTANRSPRSARRSIVRWASRLAFAGACAAVIGIVVTLVALPRITGGAALTVLTGSMTPDIPVGSVVLIRPVDARSLEVGDVATYQVSPESRALVTHRVIEVRGSGADLTYVFKGDANRGADTRPVPPEAVRGEVWFHVPYLGTARDAMRGTDGWVLLLVVALGGYAVLQLTGGLKDRRRGAGPVPGGGAERTVVLGRPAVIAEVRLSAGDEPVDAARRWGGLVLEHDADSVTLLLLPPADEVRTVLDLLDLGGAARTEVWDVDAALTGIARPASRDVEEAHAVDA